MMLKSNTADLKIVYTLTKSLKSVFVERDNIGVTAAHTYRLKSRYGLITYYIILLRKKGYCN